MPYPTGVAVDSSGNLFAADHFYMTLWEAAAPTYSKHELAYSGYGSESLEGIAVDTSGNVYVSMSHKIGKWTRQPDGSFSFSTFGNATMVTPAGIAVDSSGNVYVSDVSRGAIVKETPQPNGTYSETILFNHEQNGLALFKGNLYMEGIAVDGSGNIYIADAGNNRLLKETPDGSGGYTQSVVDSGFSILQGITVDGKGNIYAVDAGAKEILVESPSSGGYTRTVLANASGTGLREPHGVAVDAQGDVYVSDLQTGVLLLRSQADVGAVPLGTTVSFSVTFTFDQPDNILIPWEKGGIFSNVFSSDIKVDPNNAGTCYEHSFVAGDSCWVNLIFYPSQPGPRYDGLALLDRDAVFSATGLVRGTGVSPLVTFQNGAQSVAVNTWTNSPQAIARDGSGNLYVAESNSGGDQLQMYHPNGSSYSARNVTGNLSHAMAVAVDGYGSLYVADAGNNRVLKETPQSNLHGAIASWEETVVASGLASPMGVAVDGAGNVYIADTENSRILKETLVNDSYTQTEIVTGLLGPQGLTVDSSGCLYIADTFNNRVIVVSPNADGSYSITATFGGMNHPYGVAVDGGGSVYIADTGNDRVVKETLSNGAYTESVLASGLDVPASLAVDGSGNVYIASAGGNAVLKLDYATPPSLSFATTDAGATSSDSPKTVTVQNSGNTALTFPVPSAGNNPSLAPNFLLDDSASNACPVLGTSSSRATLAPGASCTLAIGFAPTESGTISGSLVLTDNHMDAGPPNYTRQTIPLTGTATAPVSITVTPSAPLIVTGETQQFTATAAYSDNLTQDVTSLVDWSSSNTSIATISTGGRATGKAVGATQITASMGTVQSQVTLTVNPVPVGSIAVHSGNNQSTNVYTQFGFPLVVRVLDSHGLPVAGETVTFSSPTSGASASFSTVTTYTPTNVATTGSAGTASVYATANSATGTYPVTATAGALSTTFNLTNAIAPSFVVTTLTDGAAVASNCTNQSQAGAVEDAHCSLRDAIAQAKVSANAISLGDPTPTYLIRFSSSLNLSAATPGTYLLTAGVLTLGTNLNIEGPGANRLTISGMNSSQVFSMGTGTNLLISGVTITGGKATSGGAIFNNQGTLTVANCVFSGNTSTYDGGAIGTNSTLTVTGSTFSNNVAGSGYQGGAIQIVNGTVTVSNSTFSGNAATYGGGIHSGGSSTLTVTNSTFANNSATTGGGLDNEGTATLANNLILDGHLVGTLTDSGGNVFSDSVGVTALGSYGGMMPTLLPLPGSAAICAGTQSNAAALPSDQRGYFRTTTYDGTVCVDAGAVQTEYESVQFASNSHSGIANHAVSPAPVVSVTEHGQSRDGIPITLTFTGTGTPTGLGPVSTASGTGATFASVMAASPASGTLSVSLPITASGNAVQPSALTASTLLDIAPATVHVTMGTSPTGLSFSVDGDTYTSSQTIVWDAGSQHTLTATTPQNASGTKYTFTGWSDGVTTATDTVTVPSADSAYTATFSPSYWFLVSATAGGTASATDGSNNDVNGSYLASGSAVTLKATPASGYYFKNWSGMANASDVSSANSATTTLTIPSTPETIKANFALIPSYVVTTNSDLSAGVAGNCVDQNTGQSSTGGTDNSNCSLRDALAAAAAHGGNVTFNSQAFQASGTSASNTITITHANGALQVPNGAVITGLTDAGGAPFILLDGGGKSRVFNVPVSTASASISSLIITHGVDIVNEGTLTIASSVIRDHSGSMGGGIRNTGTLTVTSSTISGNSADIDGGGIWNCGTLTVTNSTISGNSAGGNGGGIENNGPNLTLIHTTVIGNYAHQGGGFASDAPSGQVTLTNSIVSENRADNGPNWVGTFTQTGSVVDGSAKLTPLGNYGGATQTMVPLPGSPAICAGTMSGVTLPSTDQRGAVRTTTYGGTTCADAGAVQTHYGLVFSTQPSAVPPATQLMAKVPFQAGVTLQENAASPASAVFAQARIAIPLTLTGTGTLSPFSLTTDITGVANSNSLVIDTHGTGNTLTASLPLTASGATTPVTISATSNAFDVVNLTLGASLTLNPSQQSYGTAIPASAVSVSADAGGTPLSGIWTYTAINLSAPYLEQSLVLGVTVLPTGNYTIHATFTPDNPAYAIADLSGATLYTVTSATPTISAWPTATAITYRQTLASSTLSGGTTSVAGTFSFAAPGTSPNAGPYTASVVFTPTDTTNYATVNGTVNVAVNQTTPVVTWANPADIVYGTPLSNVQLHASSTTSGEWSYTPQAGTLLSAGSNQPLHATFTPTDTTNYNTTSATAYISVTKAPLMVKANDVTLPYGSPQSSFRSALNGTVSGMVSGDGITAFYTTSAAPESKPGTYTITPSLNDPEGKLANYTVSSVNGTLTIARSSGTVTALQTSASAVFMKNDVTLTATVSATPGATPTGTVTFYDATTSLGTALLNSSGTAVLTIGTLAVGSHQVTASYSGSNDYAPSTSSVATVQVQDFQLVVSNGAVTTATVPPGGLATYTFTVSPTNGTTFPEGVTLSLSGLPAGATYTLSPAKITAGSSATTLTVQVQTTKLTAMQRRVHPGSFAFALLPAFGMVYMRRRMRGGLIALAGLMMIMFATVSCGSLHSGTLTQQPKTYTLTMIATSGPLSHSLNLGLTVQ